ncbi:hypothetical protein [Inquilinus sp. OTU3971]|uniref:hypothetical protein n=1 Tax=Inquilinus sp. OTU3971 TaxID=3043855 RepID=UPI00313C4389
MSADGLRTAAPGKVPAAAPRPSRRSRRDQEYIAEDITTGLSRPAAGPGRLGRLGLRHARRLALAGLLAIAPGATIANTRAGVPWKQAEVLECYLDALRRARLPE